MSLIRPYISALLLCIVPGLTAQRVSQYEPFATARTVNAFTDGGTSAWVAGHSLFGRKAFTHGFNECLGDQYGPIPVKSLFAGLDDAAIQARGSLTKKYFSDTGTKVTASDAKLTFDNPENYYKLARLNANIEQHLFSGFYIRGAMHFLEQEYKLDPSLDINTDTKANAFLADINNVLAENGFDALGEQLYQFDMDAASFYAGWQGSFKGSTDLVQELCGAMEIGYELSRHNSVHKAFRYLLPQHTDDGFTMNLLINARVFKYFMVKLQGQSTVYRHDTTQQTIAPDDTSLDPLTRYSGPMLLTEELVKKDPGTLWGLQAALRFDNFYAFFAEVGYSFFQQEKSQLIALEEGYIQTKGSTPSTYQLSSRSEYLNYDPRLTGWNHHTIYAAAGIARSPLHSWVVPEMSIFYSLPLAGRHSVEYMSGWGGNVGLGFQWTF